jgi:hypothetical protein
MKRSILLLVIATSLSSCAWDPATGTATFTPDAETVRAVSELVRTVRAEK